MRIVPLTLKAANEFVLGHHRHNKEVIGHKFAIGIEENGELIGVSIAGRPISRMLDKGKTIEIRRVCVKDGYPNACSKLLGRMKQICQLMGFEKIITYTLQKESGSSLRAVGARPVANVPPSSWHKGKRKGAFQPVYLEKKIRWELNAPVEPVTQPNQEQEPVKDAA